LRRDAILDETRVNVPKLILKMRLVFTWVDPASDEAQDENVRDNINELRHLNITIDTFDDIDRCDQFIDETEEQKLFLVITGDIEKYPISTIHDKTNVDTIYILHRNESYDIHSVKQWPKVRGQFTNVFQHLHNFKSGHQEK